MINTEEMDGMGKASASLMARSSTSLILLTNDVKPGKPVYLFVKRILDVAAATAFLLVLFPFFLVIAVLIAAKDGMPILFKHKRIGMNGKDFYVYKFRTMRNDAEEYLDSHPELMEEFSKSFKLDQDPRITPLGRWLRSYSLDELPQLLNVISGEMTLVGPRPIVRDELDKYGANAATYLSLKPGCAGLWQCSGRSDTTYEERVLLDLDYAQKAGVLFDFQIFFSTVVAIFKRQGAR